MNVSLSVQYKKYDAGGASACKVAGIYLAVFPNTADILQLSSDGNMTLVLPGQFHGSRVIYPPGTDPMAKDAKIVEGSAFTCRDPINFRRLAIE